MKARSDRGMALLIVLGVVVLLSMMVAVAMSWSKNDRSRGAKLVHNLTVQELAESTLQFGRGYYAQNYALWNTHLAYFVSARTVAQVKTDHPELIAPLPVGTGYDCFTYAKDDVDELPPKEIIYSAIKGTPSTQSERIRSRCARRKSESRRGSSAMAPFSMG